MAVVELGPSEENRDRTGRTGTALRSPPTRSTPPRRAPPPPRVTDPPHSLPVPVGGSGGAVRSGGGGGKGGPGGGWGAELGGFFSAVSAAAASHECPRSDSSAMGRGVSRGSSHAWGARSHAGHPHGGNRPRGLPPVHARHGHTRGSRLPTCGTDPRGTPSHAWRTPTWAPGRPFRASTHAGLPPTHSGGPLLVGSHPRVAQSPAPGAQPSGLPPAHSGLPLTHSWRRPTRGTSKCAPPPPQAWLPLTHSG